MPQKKTTVDSVAGSSTAKKGAVARLKHPAMSISCTGADDHAQKTLHDVALLCPK
jgi:hypothetical protein